MLFNLTNRVRRSAHFVVCLFLGTSCFYAGVVTVRSQCASPSFKAAARFAVGTGPTSIATGDFNADGKPDLATANTGSSLVSVLIANGGAFGPATNFAVGTSPVSIAVAHLNNDANADLVVVNRDSNNVSVLLGDGSGGFGAATNSLTGSSPRSVAIADLNSDGKSDLAVANFFSNSVSVLLGNGNGSFAAPTSFGTGMGPTFVAAGDLNGDGKSDLVVANFQSENVTVMIGNGSGGFGSITNIASGFIIPIAVVIADFNSDSKMDIAVAGDVGVVNILTGNGAGGFSAPSQVYSQFGNRLSHVAGGDLNSDGKPDLIISNWTANLVTILLGVGNGSFSQPIVYSPGDAPWAVTVADLNSDSKMDLAVVNQGSNDVTILLGDGAGHFADVDLFALTANIPRAIAVGDYNNDGRDDVAVTTGQPFRAVFFQNDGAGNFTISANLTLNNSPNAITTGDFDNDGNLDVAIASTPNHNLTLLRGNGAGAFLMGGTFGAGFRPTAITAGDFNEDGNADLAVTNESSATISVLLGNGSAGFAAPTSFAVHDNPQSIVAGDFNNDGHFDLAIGNSGSNDVSILLGAGSGAFTGAPNVAVAARPTAIAVGDLNGDGNADLAVANATSSKLSVLMGNGSGAFASPVTYVTGFFPTAILMGDFNGDNLLDLAVVEPNDGLSVFLNAGAGTFGTSTNFRTGGRPTGLVAGDFNLDGKIDLATANDTSQTLAILSNTCASVPPPQPTLSVSNATVSEPVAGVTTLAFTVSLSQASNQAISVSYRTRSIDAASGSDFQTTAGRLLFMPGETTKVVMVAVNGDTLDEFDEQIRLFLSYPLNAKLNNTQGVGTILDNDPPPTIAINDVTLTEGNSGTTGALFTVILSTVSGKPISVDFAASDGSATSASDYLASAGTLNFAAGEITKTISVSVKGDTTNEQDETFFVTLTNPQNVTINRGQATATIVNDDTPRIQLSSSTYSTSEAAGTASVTVNRTGDTSAAATVRISTSDVSGLTNCGVVTGAASERCDYVTSIGTVSFASGENAKNFSIPVIDDVLVEGNETFTVTLSNATGGTIISPSAATVTILDNDTSPSTTNPIDGVEFFVAQMYRDILGRQPDQGGFQNWVNTLAPCPNGGFGEPPTSNCDRLHVAAGFFQSDEFLNRGYWAFRFYMVSFNQRPTYAQFIPDMSQVGGPKSPAEEETSKVAFADAFVQRPEFLSRYGSLSGQALADALTQTGGLPTFTVAAGMTNGQILRAIAERQSSLDKFLTEGTVSILYFGFQRRDPDTIGYQNNLDTLNASPNNLRHMIFIFIYSTEYRGRFGPN